MQTPPTPTKNNPAPERQTQQSIRLKANVTCVRALAQNPKSEMKAKASSFRPSNLAAVCIGAACAFVFCFDCLELPVARRKFRRKATGSRCASLPLLAGRIWEIGFRETVCPWDALHNCTLPCHGHEDEHGYVRPSQETDKFCRLRAALDYTCSGEGHHPLRGKQRRKNPGPGGITCKAGTGLG